MRYPTLYVLRHGETEWNAEGRFQGSLNSPLTAKGRAQAVKQGDLLANLDFAAIDVRVSPQGRAFETAAIALSRHAAWLRTDDRLREIGVGEWSGKLRAGLTVDGVVPPDTPDGPLALYESAPEGEGFANLRARCQAFLHDLTRPTLCVTHGITSRMLRCVALGLSNESIGDLPGGQGNVFIVQDGVQKELK